MLDGAETTKTELRPYQVEVIAELRRVIEAGQRRVILVAPTGAGKTVIAAKVTEAAVADGKRVLFLSHRREIIRQTSLKLSGYDLEHGIIQAGLVANPERPVQVASIQTLWTRAMRLDRMPAGGQPFDHRRMPPSAGADLSRDHKAISERDAARSDGHAVPR